MKRDWELIRKILSALESKPSPRDVLKFDDSEDYDGELVSYQIKLLIEAGLIEGDCSQTMQGPLDCWATCLTWTGHEFLDQIRSETIWSKAKKRLKDEGIDLSFESIKLAVSFVIKSLLS
jgi:hypothetical protein